MKENDKFEKVKNLLEKKDLEGAKKLCKKNFKDKRFISYYIKILFIENKFDEAEELCKENLDYPSVASQYISVLIRTNRLEEAKDFCEKYRDLEKVAGQYLIILSELGANEKVEELAKTYPYNVNVSRSYISFLIKNHEYDKALEICEKHPFDEDIKELKKIILSKLNVIESKNKDFNDNLHLVQKEVMDLLREKKYKDAKELLKPYIDDSKMFDIYIYVIEKERINNNKTMK